MQPLYANVLEFRFVFAL